MTTLTDLQERVLKIISRHDRENPITNSEIAEIVGMPKPKDGKPGANLRAVINSIRSKGWPICASTKGYWYAQSEEELGQYLTELRGRIAKIQQAMAGLTEAADRVGRPYGESDYIPLQRQNRNIRKFKVRSRTHADKFYVVAYWESGYSCECPGYQHRGDCHHVAQVLARIEAR